MFIFLFELISPFIMYLNPAHTSNYQAETFMGRVRPLVAGSAQGCTMLQCTAKAHSKWVRALDMTFRDPETWLKSLNGEKTAKTLDTL